MTKKVLIVDDEQNIAISVEYLMRREGFDVSVAKDGEEGLAMIRSTKPDLVLLDVMMPKMDGFQVCSEVRADASLAGVRIIMLTAKGREAEIEKGLSLGADAYIPKPFSTSDLVSRVKALLEPKE
ncbi:MAG: response regulator [Gammaproteobacteria bacterium]|nr:response regulator [Gammaproteobacteria bacterium]MCP5410345.1 response regulator [Chromatiaceae bacterium]MCP5443115.1 response regulator [Chromatiaceae bacterium]